MLFDLPAELTDHVVKQLNNHSDFLRLGSSCKQARAACKPKIFSDLRIQIGRESQNDRNISLLKSLSRGETDVAKFVHNLSIFTIFPHRYNSRRSELADAYNRTACTKARALERMLKLIVRVIPQFVSLEYIHCDLEPSGGYKAADVDTIVRALASLPCLTSLSLDFGHGPFLLVPPYLTRSSLSQFKNLHSVEIWGEASSYETVLGPLLANNPGLIRLTIFGGRSVLVTSLSEIEARYDIRAVPAITSIFVGCSLDATIPRFLPHLRHLRTANVDIPDDFWTALTHKGVKLVTLLTNTTTDILMAYLESYSGLEVLSLSPVNDHHAEAFYRHVLVQHSYSLRKLSIEIKSVGKWCVGPRVLEVLSRCVGLVELNVPIYATHQPGVVYDPRQVAVSILEILS
ncbi:uncharacterized protein EV420DRAFT_1638416 [Desarmillaria tabescens]|uniref:F-box domain-containing protein n=1 Tax=Armillaria tabescens TaxID=1929756 RepID=A0AA39T4A9_ARMTA|nr:uncharacterized protein EV420DRAFT_1638416 [Desarmillaria tabescens]KAK0463481.1 hypothetical protein EV420DRAFT_1638416 [Desarmillaria tabescens]